MTQTWPIRALWKRKTLLQSLSCEDMSTKLTVAIFEDSLLNLRIKYRGKQA